ncbi:hypothetical protein LCGC14_2929510 [marine sediment metagenome]|uniref:Uncharacterized protein n=1 Tax=marine sediment metagenome TaxID=412755 RepID=A0A0F8ZU03_9ZZZZ
MNVSVIIVNEKLSYVISTVPVISGTIQLDKRYHACRLTNHINTAGIHIGR